MIFENRDKKIYMRLKLIENKIIQVYTNSKGEKLLSANQFQEVIEIGIKFCDFIRYKTVELIENTDYYKIYSNEQYGDNLKQKIGKYYITLNTAERLCFLGKSEICKKLQEEILNNKEKDFLEILQQELNKIKQNQRIEEIKKITIEDKEYPESLRKIKNPPQKIYIKGNEELLKQNGIAVIGSRTTSNYGRKMCKIFVNNLVGYNLNIISGLAIGIDTAAHKNCLEAKGKTIAVLPCGLKHIYPRNNEILYKRIIEEGGLIVSEYELDEKETSDHFRERNRIVAGLAIGTLVIESHRKSGTSITVRNTEEQNKRSFCIPSSLENTKGAGNNEMIRDKRAKLVTTVEDIIVEYPELKLKKRENYEFLDIMSKRKSKIKENTDTNKNEKNKEEKNMIKEKKSKEEDNDIEIKGINISEENLDIYNAIIEGAETIDEIVRKTQKDIREVTYKLTMLEIENVIQSLPGKRFKIKE